MHIILKYDSIVKALVIFNVSNYILLQGGQIFSEPMQIIILL